MSKILLIDDERAHAEELKAALERGFTDAEIEVEIWSPSAADQQPDNRFSELTADNQTVLVVTDYDLTSQQLTGFFGSAVVDWCKRRFIPVCDYSKGNALRRLPKETDQYEIRVPAHPEEAAVHVRAIALGFSRLRSTIDAGWDEPSTKRSPAAILATVLGRPFEEGRLALYGAKIASANAALISELSDSSKPGTNPSYEMKTVLPYILGHLLLNVILRFPGPILHEDALAAFLAINKDELNSVLSSFEGAKYQGPFSELCSYFWTSAVEQQLNSFRAQIAELIKVETPGEVNRKTMASVLNRQLKEHDCSRCGGAQGGFFCPFLKRAVCLRPSCLVVSNAWIPQGARLCRIEKDFYDEWAPLLGF